MRVTNQMMSKNLLNNLNNNMRQMDKYNNQLSTGKKFSLPGDDPVGVVRSMDLKSAIKRNEQYVRNIDQAINWVETTDEALDSANGIINRVREQALYGANGSLSDTDRNAVADEVEQLREGLIEIANTNHNGRYLFAGQQTLTKPFPEEKVTSTENQTDNYLVGDSQFEVVQFNNLIDSANLNIGEFEIENGEELDVNKLDDDQYVLTNEDGDIVGHSENGIEYSIIKNKLINITDDDITAIDDITDEDPDYFADVKDFSFDQLETEDGEKLDVNKLDDENYVLTDQDGYIVGYSENGIDYSIINDMDNDELINIADDNITEIDDITDEDPDYFADVEDSSFDQLETEDREKLDVNKLDDGNYVLTNEDEDVVGQSKNGIDYSIINDKLINIDDDNINEMNDITDEDYFDDSEEFEFGQFLTDGRVKVTGDQDGITLEQVSGRSYGLEDESGELVALSKDGHEYIVLEDEDLTDGIYEFEEPVTTGILDSNQDGDQLELVYQGDQNEINREIAAGVEVGISQDGSFLKDTIDELDELVGNLREGELHKISNDRIRNLDQQIDNLLRIRSETGAKQNRLDLTKERLKDDEIKFKQLLSENQDTDIAEAIMNLQMSENVYRASLSTGARIIQPTLVDFLR
ncbi:flagellar hook-associated protein FlgL [Natroniella sulfidigena]|uniref:flagellar hook-associated protein FlgL n=1 Tax=Natroniella sulfidigena TaxID=723921 RepID=UPI00200B8270|nr:flagellar hook-associated protein FlgL [Natroniella sulfidigena]MCK8816032.1 flagellar hook-associated protein FlgL [Natroniella sulfidigena]